MRIESGSAAFGGGTLALGGSASLARGGVEGVALTIGARDVGLSYPAGSLSDRLRTVWVSRGGT